MPRAATACYTLLLSINSLQRSSLVVMLLLIVGCASISSANWDKRYGIAQPKELLAAPVNAMPSRSKLTYERDARAIIERRCVVCHGCYDAPCQLKLESYQGLLRGANSAKVYDGKRLLGASLTRLFEDAQSTAQWRHKGFHPVLNERSDTSRANINAGVMAQLLLLKKQHPLPAGQPLPDSFELDLKAQQQCPRIENFATYAAQKPLWGMPYGLPGLNDKEHKTLLNWLADGAPPGAAKPLASAITRDIARWEQFLNGDSLKQQLVNRYIYEHLFLAQLYFPAAPEFHFRLVRSSTPPGQPIARISTTRPFDEPGVARVYYRLWQDPSSLIAKTRMPYRLDQARMQQWQTLFLTPAYEVNRLPPYTPAVAANPFITFAQLPIHARYSFMLDEAQFTIMNYIKGPVCRGQVALNVIQDHFWVFFFAPDNQASAIDAKFLAENSQHLQLPAEAGNTLMPLTNWLRYSELQKEYLVAKARLVTKKVAQQGGLELDMIWDGDSGRNANAALTIFRHSDSASVHKGLIGQMPKTAWVIDYPLLERIHYLLVAGFDVYGNLSHQLMSRLYMDFLRIEGEMNFVSLLPKTAQQQEMAFWYRDAETNLQTYLDLYINQLKLHNGIHYYSATPKTELFQKLKLHLGKAGDSPHNIRTGKLAGRKLQRYEQLQAISGTALGFLPQTTLLLVPEIGLFTLVNNSAYSNLSSLFGEDKRRLPGEDQLSLARGIIGAYPNSFMRVPEAQLGEFTRQLQALRSEADYQQLRRRFGIGRTHPEFWAFSDELHRRYRQQQPDDAGWLDYNRLENR